MEALAPCWALASEEVERRDGHSHASGRSGAVLGVQHERGCHTLQLTQSCLKNR